MLFTAISNIGKIDFGMFRDSSLEIMFPLEFIKIKLKKELILS